MEKSGKGKREKDWENVCKCAGGKAANLNWMERECFIEGTAFEKGKEVSFVDV